MAWRDLATLVSLVFKDAQGKEQQFLLYQLSELQSRCDDLDWMESSKDVSSYRDNPLLRKRILPDACRGECGKHGFNLYRSLRLGIYVTMKECDADTAKKILGESWWRKLMVWFRR